MESADNLLGDTDVRIGDMDAVPRDVVKTIVDVNTKLRLTSNQLNGFKKGPWPIFLRQVIRAAALDHSKHTACASEYVNVHKASFVRNALYHEEGRSATDPPQLQVERRNPRLRSPPYKTRLDLIVEASSR
jgi:hypothetical protein